MSFDVRPAGPDDVPDIAVFQTACWNEAYAGIVSDAYLAVTTVPVREQRWWRRLANGERSIALTRTAGAVAGVVSWRSGAPDELSSLYVGATYRGTGLADALLDYAIGDRPAALWVFEANRRARRFYLRHGFRYGGQQRFDEDTGVLEQRLVRLGG